MQPRQELPTCKRRFGAFGQPSRHKDRKWQVFRCKQNTSAQLDIEKGKDASLEFDDLDSIWADLEGKNAQIDLEDLDDLLHDATLMLLIMYSSILQKA